MAKYLVRIVYGKSLQCFFWDWSVAVTVASMSDLTKMLKYGHYDKESHWRSFCGDAYWRNSHGSRFQKKHCIFRRFLDLRSGTMFLYLCATMMRNFQRHVIRNNDTPIITDHGYRCTKKYSPFGVFKNYLILWHHVLAPRCWSFAFFWSDG
jgi:hypothetical protein